MLVSIILGLFMLLISSLHVQSEESGLPLGKFGSKTAYRNLEQHKRPSPVSTPPPECEARQILFVTRHGTRQPSVKDMRYAERLALRLSHSAHAPSSLTDAFRRWKCPFQPDHAKDLTPVGFEEQELLGVRTQQRFMDLLHRAADRVHFFSSDKQRALQSAAAFQRGLGAPFSEMKVQVDNDLLRFFDECEQYVANIDKNKAALFEFTAFKNGPEMAAATARVIKRWHLDDVTLLPGDLKTIFQMCAFEVANNLSTNSGPAATHSPWCQMLTDDADTLDVIEYLLDLKHFWLKAYGYELSHKVSCPLAWRFADLLKTAAANSNPSESDINAAFLFGHAETVFPLVSLLGLFNDSASASINNGILRANNYDIYRSKRLFRSSHIMPFSGNLAVLLYTCPHKINFVDVLINERSVLFEQNICSDGKGLCELDDLLQRINVQCNLPYFDYEKSCKFGNHPHEEL